MKRLARLSALVATVVLFASVATASPITFGLTNGSRSATALFENSGGDLVVTLTNTSSADAMLPTDLLTAIFFDIAGNPTLTRISAVICPTCSILHPEAIATDPGPNGVGGEWAYKRSTSGVAFGGEYGLSSTGLGVFGSGDRFSGSNLSGPAEPGGPQYGITTASDNPSTGNGALNTPLIKNQVIFTLGGFGALDPSLTISGLTFLYGTALDEPSFSGTCLDCTPTTDIAATPEPASLILLGSGLLGAVRYRRRSGSRV